MSLRKVTLFILLLTSLGLMVMMALIFRLVVRDGFSGIEEQLAGQNMERVVRAIENEVSRVRQHTFDWAVWDDTYQYVDDRNEEYEQGNLKADSFTSLGLTAVVLLDREGQVVWGHGIDAVADELTDPPAGMVETMRGFLPAEGGGLPEEVERKGAMLLPDGVHLFALLPILTSHNEGPARGYLLMAHSLDQALAATLGRLTLLDITVMRADDEAMTPDHRRAMDDLKASGGVRLRLLDADSMAACRLFPEPQARRPSLSRPAWRGT